MTSNAKVFEEKGEEALQYSNVFEPSLNLGSDATGNLLYHIHSVYFKPLLFAKEETSLLFYEHVVIATLTSQLWCFPKRVTVEVIPRFKIINAAFSLGPRRIPMAAWLFILSGFILILFGSLYGGCGDCYYCTSSSGTCAMLVIGILFLLIPAPLLILLPIVFKYHYIFLDVKGAPTKFFGIGAVKGYEFRFKKIGFDHTTDKKAAFDQFYLVDYVYGTLAQAGNVVTNEAHLLSHLNHAALCTPIVPVHADNTINDIVLPNIMQRRNHHKSSVRKSEDV